MHVGKPEDETYVSLATRHPQMGIVLSPEILELYKRVNDSLPVVIVQAINEQLRSADFDGRRLRLPRDEWS